MIEEVTFLWPDRPMCHDHDPWAQRFDPARWLPPKDDWGGFRTCSFCGCIHPEDLYSALLAGAKMSGSDWKYGWPHKFYVDGIPNSNAGKLFRSTSMSLRGAQPTEEEWAEARQWLKSGGELRVEDELIPGSRSSGRWLCVYSPQSEKTNGKWYNTHLNDLNPVAFSAMVEMLMRHTNIRFFREGEKLKYLAPRAGYQKA